MTRGEELVKAGYYQTSARYRMVGRIPPGKTPQDALFEAEMAGTLKHVKALRQEGKKPVSTVFRTPDDMERYWRKTHRTWVTRLGDAQCVDQYIRVYARDEDSLTLSKEEWDSFKKAGGRGAHHGLYLDRG